jgi:hypothetical protein
MPKKSVSDQNFEVIKSYCLNPAAELSPLPKEQREILDRWISAARTLDKYPVIKKAVAIHRIKYPKITQYIAYEDMSNARRLFNSLHTFDYDWWHTWLLNDITRQIEASSEAGDLRSWAEGHRNLIKAIGERPEVPLDPKLTQKHVFIIPIQVKNKIINVNYDNFVKIPAHVRRKLSEDLENEITDVEVEEMLNT